MLFSCVGSPIRWRHTSTLYDRTTQHRPAVFLYFSFCSDILSVAHAVLHESIPRLFGIMISKSALVGEAVLTSILMSLIVENVYGVWPLSWTLTRQALQSLRVSAAMPDQCTRRNITHLTGCAVRRRGCRGGQLHAKLNLKPGSYSQNTDVTVNRRNSITSWLYAHYILYYC